MASNSATAAAVAAAMASSAERAGAVAAAMSTGGMCACLPCRHAQSFSMPRRTIAQSVHAAAAAHAMAARLSSSL